MVCGNRLGSINSLDVQKILCQVRAHWKPSQLRAEAIESSKKRFSTVPFNLDSLDNQIHLTNNAIQRNFDISEHCHEEIPEEKMWYCDELDTYLKPGIHKLTSLSSNNI